MKLEDKSTKFQNWIWSILLDQKEPAKQEQQGMEWSKPQKSIFHLVLWETSFLL